MEDFRQKFEPKIIHCRILYEKGLESISSISHRGGVMGIEWFSFSWTFFSFFVLKGWTLLLFILLIILKKFSMKIAPHWISYEKVSVCLRRSLRGVKLGGSESFELLNLIAFCLIFEFCEGRAIISNSTISSWFFFWSNILIFLNFPTLHWSKALVVW